MIRVTCPTCSTSYDVPDLAAGKSGACKKCGAKVRVPDQSGGGTVAGRGCDSVGVQPRGGQRGKTGFFALLVGGLELFSWLVAGLGTVLAGLVAVELLGRADSAVKETAVAATFSAVAIGLYTTSRCIEKFSHIMRTR